MAISFIGQASDGGTGTAISITHGLTILEDDVIVCCIGADGSGTTCVDNNGANSFTEEYDGAPSGNTMSAKVYSRIAGASEPASYAFTLSVSEGFSAMLFQFRGVDLVNLWDVDPTTTTWAANLSDVTPLTAASMSTTVDNAEGICFICADSGSATFASIDNSYLNENEPNGGLRCATWRKNWTTAGATGVITAIPSAAKKYIGCQMALKPSTVSNIIIEVATGPWR